MVTSYIKNKISGSPPDTLFFNRDFLNYGARGAVDMCLSRMAIEGYIKRLCYGIYVRHDCTREFTATELGEAKARRFDRTITKHPIYNARALGFTDQKPIFVSFKTQGRTSNFTSPHGRIFAYGTSPRRIALEQTKTGNKINALWWLKKQAVTEQHIYDVLSKLKRSEKEEFLWSHDLMPGWLSDLVHSACDYKVFFPLNNKRSA